MKSQKLISFLEHLKKSDVNFNEIERKLSDLTDKEIDYLMTITNSDKLKQILSELSEYCIHEEINKHKVEEYINENQSNLPDKIKAKLKASNKTLEEIQLITKTYEKNKDEKLAFTLLRTYDMYDLEDILKIFDETKDHQLIDILVDTNLTFTQKLILDYYKKYRDYEMLKFIKEENISIMLYKILEETKNTKLVKKLNELEIPDERKAWVYNNIYLKCHDLECLTIYKRYKNNIEAINVFENLFKYTQDIKFIDRILSSDMRLWYANFFLKTLNKDLVINIMSLTKNKSDEFIKNLRIDDRCNMRILKFLIKCDDAVIYNAIYDFVLETNRYDIAEKLVEIKDINIFFSILTSIESLAKIDQPRALNYVNAVMKSKSIYVCELMKKLKAEDIFDENGIDLEEIVGKLNTLEPELLSYASILIGSSYISFEEMLKQIDYLKENCTFKTIDELLESGDISSTIALLKKHKGIFEITSTTYLPTKKQNVRKPVKQD